MIQKIILNNLWKWIQINLLQIFFWQWSMYGFSKDIF